MQHGSVRSRTGPQRNVGSCLGGGNADTRNFVVGQSISGHPGGSCCIGSRVYSRWKRTAQVAATPAGTIGQVVDRDRPETALEVRSSILPLLGALLLCRWSGLRLMQSLQQTPPAKRLPDLPVGRTARDSPALPPSAAARPDSSSPSQDAASGRRGRG